MRGPNKTIKKQLLSSPNLNKFISSIQKISRLTLSYLISVLTKFENHTMSHKWQHFITLSTWPPISGSPLYTLLVCMHLIQNGEQTQACLHHSICGLNQGNLSMFTPHFRSFATTDIYQSRLLLNQTNQPNQRAIFFNHRYLCKQINHGEYIGMESLYA